MRSLAGLCSEMETMRMGAKAVLTRIGLRVEMLSPKV